MARILVIRLSSLGDVVLTIPVYKALRQAFPEAHIAALVKEEFADVLAANPDLNERLTLRRGESLRSVVGRVREGRFDIVVDLHANFRSRVISFFSGARRRVRYRKAALARRLFVGWRWASSSLQQHTLDRYMEVLTRIGVPAPARKVLVIQTAFLGDAVLTTPLLTALQEKVPEARISLLCTPEIADVFRNHPAISDLILFDKRGKDRSVLGQWRLAKLLKERQFDVAVIPHRSFTSALLARMAGIPRRIGFSSSQGRWLLTDQVPFQWGVHDVDRNLNLLQPLGVSAGPATLSIRPEPAAQESVSARLAASGVGPHDLVLGINPGSVWATKRWLPEGFAAVADRVISELGAKVIFFGGKRDIPAIAAVLQGMRQQPINWGGETDLRELIAAISLCDAFLTNDSGPMHIAVASQVPTVAIFGPTTRELGFFPYGPGHTVIEKDLACRPCGLHGADRCPLGHFQCMKTITVEEVFEAVRMKLAKAPHPPLSLKGEGQAPCPLPPGEGRAKHGVRGL